MSTGISIEPTVFRTLLRRHAAGVVVVTAAGNPPAGLTATSFTSVSVCPPLVSFCVARGASTWRTVTRAKTVAVHFLAVGQEHLARTFATSGIDRFAECGAWHPGPAGVPLLNEALPRLVCHVMRRVEAGDHTSVIAGPHTGYEQTDEAPAPLVYHAGNYGTFQAPQHAADVPPVRRSRVG